jgi:hypothetical protein
VDNPSQPFHFSNFPVKYDSAVVKEFTLKLYAMTLSSSKALDDNHWALSPTTSVKHTDSAATSGNPFGTGNSVEELKATAAGGSAKPDFKQNVAHYSFYFPKAGFYVF